MPAGRAALPVGELLPRRVACSGGAELLASPVARLGRATIERHAEERDLRREACQVPRRRHTKERASAGYNNLCHLASPDANEDQHGREPNREPGTQRVMLPGASTPLRDLACTPGVDWRGLAAAQ